MSSTIPRRVPDSRHPFPELRAAFTPRGWCVFRTHDGLGRTTAHAVLCFSLPVACVKVHGFTEHVRGLPDEVGPRLSVAASAIENHAKTCALCAHALTIAARYAVQQ